MSGPKSSEWEVIENRRRIEQARQSALGEADALYTEIDRMAAEVDVARARIGTARRSHLCHLPARPRRDDALDVLERHLVTLADERERLRAEVAAVEATAQLISLMADSAARVRSASRALRDDAEAQAARRAEDASRILRRVPVGISGADRDRLVTLAHRFIGAPSPGAARGAELELRRLVQTHQDEQRQRQRALKRLRELRARLRGLEGSAVDEARRELAAVERGERHLDDTLDQRIVAIADCAREESDRAYAMEVLQSEFAALGYEVDKEFATVFMRGGTMIMSKGDSGGYAVEVAVRPSLREIDTRLIRLSDDEMSETERRLRDLDAEKSWCEEYAQLLGSASRRMVRARIRRRTPPGASAVPFVLDARTGADQRRRSELRQRGAAERRNPSSGGKRRT